ncbi:MAG: DUF2459 domain-containing protein [Phycisphaeraceae bacterium]|nr:DUF2459 domain-containing protein [Phycisphaeraceae bacterium]
MAGVGALVFLAVAAGGCATTVVPPKNPHDPVSVYIVDYGKHSSLMVPRDNDRVTEFAFSSWTWEALKWNTWLNVFPILTSPSQGTLCVKEWPGPLNEMTIRMQTTADVVYNVRVSKQDVDRLIAKLDEAYRKREDELIFHAPTGWVYVKSDTSYWSAHTCNTEVAVWLEELGCTVKGQQVYADFQVTNPGG